MSSRTIRIALIAVAALTITAVVVVTFLSDPAPGGPSSGNGPEDGESTQVTTPPTTPTPITKTDTDEASRSEADATMAIPNEIDPELGRGGFSGFVKNKDGSPIEGARVELFRGSAALIGFRGSQESTGLSVETDEEGVYTFEDLPVSTDYVVVGTKDQFGQDETTIAVRKDDMVLASDLILDITNGAKIHGITNGIGDIRVVGAKVKLYDVLAFATLNDPFAERTPAMVTTTDDKGYYEFTNVSLRAVEITVDHPEWTFATKTLNSPFQPLGDTELHFLMRIPTKIHGVVVDQIGNVIEGALVDAFELNSTPEVKGTPATVTRARATSGRDGSFSLERLRRRVQYNLTIHAEGYRIQQHGPIDSKNDDVHGVVITLEAQGGVAGVVTSPDGAVPTPFSIRVMKDHGNSIAPMGRVQSFETANGVFQVVNLDPGKYALEATAKGFAPSLSESFMVTSSTLTENVDIRLSHGATIAGALYDAAGTPISGAKITIQQNKNQGQALAGFLALLGGGANASKQPSTKSDSEGNFTIENLVPGTFQVEIIKAGYTHSAINDVALIADQTTNLGSLALTRGGTIIGQVVDGGGAGFSAGLVTCTNQVAPGQTPEHMLNKEVRPDANGRFEIPNLPAGDYLLQFKPDLSALQTENFFGQIAIAEKTKKTVRVANNGQVEQKIVLPPEVVRRG